MALAPKHEKFARLWFEGKMTGVQMAEACGVNEATIYTWKKRADVRAYYEEMIREAKLEAIAVYARNAVRAAQTTLLYLQADPIIDKKTGEVKGHRLMYPKQARQAAADIHQSINIPVKVGGGAGGYSGAAPVMILLPEKEPVNGAPSHIPPIDDEEEEDSG